MIDEREIVRRAAEALTPPEPSFDRLLQRRDRVQRSRRIRAGVLGIAVAIAVGWLGSEAIRSTPTVPADDPSEDLGIFAPVAGRIVYDNEAEVGDLGYDVGVWAIDPNGPFDTVDGRTVADDVASGLVRLGPDDMIPLAWSRDGTELLFKRSDRDQLFPEEHLYVLHADGSETQVTTEPMYLGGATISPDGSRVAFAAWGDHLGLYVVDANGGRPVRLPLPGAEGIVADPAFSPDGTRIAYVDSGEIENHLWVMDADGGNAHEILADEPTLAGGVGGLQWSPATDRLMAQGRLSDGTNVIYTFASDGSDFTQVITGGMSPYWSPDGSRIAYTIECPELTDPSCLGAGSAGLAIADADGSNVRAFGFAASGPWHPAGSAPADETTPALGESFARVDGEVLSFAFGPHDLLAVNPETGEERVLVEDLDPTVYSARWSADGRWVAYETPAEDGWELWVAGASLQPRLVATGGDPDMFASLGLYWIWSPTGANLAAIAESTLRTIDLTTGQTTDLGPIIADLLDQAGMAWAWSPDGTRITFATSRGAVYSVDVPRGERSLLARLSDEELDLVEEVLWSPDGAHIAVLTRVASDEAGRLYLMNPDGSDARVVVDDYDPLGLEWSPDGTRLAFAEGSAADGEVRIRVATMDGAAPAQIGSVSFGGCLYNYRCALTWSPDGSRIAFQKTGRDDITAFDADGAGDAGPIDELTYASWAGGSYFCECT